MTVPWLTVLGLIPLLGAAVLCWLGRIGEAGYLTRSGEDDLAGDQDYDGWWLGLRARWTP